MLLPVPWALCQPQKTHISLSNKLVALAKAAMKSPVMAKRARLAQAGWQVLACSWSWWISSTLSPDKDHRSCSAWGALSPLPCSPVLLANIVVLASPSPSLFQLQTPVVFQLENSWPSPLPPWSFPSLHCWRLPQGKEILFFYALVQYLGNDLHAFMGGACPCLEMQEKRIAWAWRALALQNIPRGGCLVSLAMPLERFVCILWG